jgi:hypothetical protein
MATSRATRSGNTPAYIRQTAPPSECPTSVAGAAPTASSRFARSSTKSGIAYMPPKAQPLSPCPRRSGAITCQSPRSARATQSQLRAWSRPPCTSTSGGAVSWPQST